MIPHSPSGQSPESFWPLLAENSAYLQHLIRLDAICRHRP